MPQAMHAANGNQSAAPHGLTTADRALLRAVTGWPEAGQLAPHIASAASGQTLLFPPLAAIILDARRAGALQGEITPAAFLHLAARLGNAPTPTIRLSRAQIGAGFRHLAIETMGFSAGRAGAAAG